MGYYQKYLKYKGKYLELKRQIYGGKPGKPPTCGLNDTPYDPTTHYCVYGKTVYESGEKKNLNENCGIEKRLQEWDQNAEDYEIIYITKPAKEMCKSDYCKEKTSGDGQLRYICAENPKK
jgi:hypothetical protein